MFACQTSSFTSQTPHNTNFKDLKRETTVLLNFTVRSLNFSLQAENGSGGTTHIQAPVAFQPFALSSLAPSSQPRVAAAHSPSSRLALKSPSTSLNSTSSLALMLTAQALPPHAPDGAALHVLANPMLWRTVTDFMSGWPFLVVQFSRDTKAKASEHVKKKSGMLYEERRGWLPHAAIEARNVKVLQVLFELHQVPHYAETYEALDFSAVQRSAVACKRLDMLQWMCANKKKQNGRAAEPRLRKWEDQLMEHAARHREPDLELMDWLYANAPLESIQLSSQLVDRAAALGSVALVQWLHAHKYEFTQHAMDDAASAGYYDVVRFLHEQRSEGCTTHAMDAAATHGHAEIVEFLHANRSEGCTVNALDGAAKNGHLAVVKFLHAHRMEGCATNAMDDAARHGHLEVVEFLHANRTEGCTTKAMDGAADNGELSVLQYLLEHRAEGFSTKPISWSSRNLSLPVVAFLHKHRATGWTTAAMDRAASDGCLEVVRFLQKHRSEGCTSYAMDTAAGRGYLDVVKFLHQNCANAKCTTYAMDSAARERHLEVVRFLHENRTEGCTKAAMTQAILKGHNDVVQFLGANRHEGFSVETVMQAAMRGAPHLRETLERFFPKSSPADKAETQI